jgi:hypothetical protein
VVAILVSLAVWYVSQRIDTSMMVNISKIMVSYLQVCALRTVQDRGAWACTFMCSISAEIDMCVRLHLIGHGVRDSIPLNCQYEDRTVASAPRASLLCTSQVMGSSSTSYNIPWPEFMQSLLDKMRLALLDIYQVTAVDCIATCVRCSCL